MPENAHFPALMPAKRNTDSVLHYYISIEEKGWKENLPSRWENDSSPASPHLVGSANEVKISPP
jgi:hypothetical protein